MSPFAPGSSTTFPPSPSPTNDNSMDPVAPTGSNPSTEDPPPDPDDTEDDDVADDDLADDDDNSSEVPDPDDVVTNCVDASESNVGVTKLRRLTREQYGNTVADLLRLEGDHASLITAVADERIGPFFSNAIAPITNLMVQQFEEAAATLAVRADVAALSPCTPSDACVAEFISSFGTRAFRRPLDQEEQDEYLDLYDVARTTRNEEQGFRTVIESMLQSPYFLYHLDVGVDGVPSADPVLATSYELASRLSYFLWNTMPDDSLFEAAATNQLQDPAQLSAQVERMLIDEQAARSIAEFHLQLFGIGDMAGVSKDASLFPQFDELLVQAMLAETSRFVNHVVREGDGSWSTLLTGAFTYPEAPLFAVYGIAEPPGFVPGMQVALDPAERAGLLTQPAFLTKHAHPNQTSPVHRGVIVRENLLCQPLPSPPADVDNQAPEPTEATTTRERFEQHEADPRCAGCHALMDPIGLGFENYDPIGAYRTRDGMFDVDARGEFIGVESDLAGEFEGAVELSQKLANSQEVRQCLVAQWFRFSLGRLESADDACIVQSIQGEFEASGGNVRSLITQIVLSDAFRRVRSLGAANTQETL